MMFKKRRSSCVDDIEEELEVKDASWVDAYQVQEDGMIMGGSSSQVKGASFVDACEDLKEMIMCWSSSQWEDPS